MDTGSLSALIIAPPGRLRDGLRTLLHASGKLAAIAQADDEPSGLEMLAQSPPALAVLDTRLGGAQAERLLRQLKHNWPQVRCLVIAHSADREQAARADGADVTLAEGFPADVLFAALGQMLAP